METAQTRRERDGSPRAPTGGTETYLFTDIEGSTRLLQALGDAFPALLLEHRRILLQAVEQEGGREAGSAGDGTFAVFPRARDALAAAAAAQRALAAHAWPGGANVAVRMGLHTGDAALAGSVYTGLDVYRAARISAAGHGGQVLLSQTTRQLVERDLPEGVSLRDLGEHHLKDLLQPEHLWQLVIHGLPSEFPPLQTLSTRPNNLPAQPTPFVGREQEVETVRQLLLRENVRLATLTGPGGIGKTRLALQAAADLITEFADGVYLVDLGAITDPDHIPLRIAESLSLKEDRNRPVAESVKEHLRRREMLLVLDNFEQVIGGAAYLSDLLAECRSLKLLVTSRIVLRVSGEHEYQLPPLPVPDPRRPPDPDAARAFPAIALFEQRAQAVKPDFTLNAGNTAAIARICAQLDGLPLAIELAAARIKLFSPQAMLSRLGSRLDLLKGGARDLPLRQQTLRQAIAWSYDLLEADERASFRRLAVFRGGWSLEAVEPVVNSAGDLGLDPLDAVAALVDQSLVRRVEASGDQPRFVMLETIREYGLECLRASGEEESVRRAHAEYFLHVAEEAEPELTGSRQGFWLDRLEPEQDNFRAAFAWVEERQDAEIGLRLGAALWRYWASRGHLPEAWRQLERLLSLPGAQGRTRARARALLGAGTLLHEYSDYHAARPLLEESLSIWRELGEKPGMAIALNNLSWIATIMGDADAAESLGAESLALNRELGEKRGIAVALHNLAWRMLWSGDLEGARRRYEEAMAVRRESGDRRGLAYMVINLAWLECVQGNYESAAARLPEAQAVLRELGDLQIGAWGVQTQARVAYCQGRIADAHRLLEEARGMWIEAGNQTSLSWTLAELTHVHLAEGDPDGASLAAEEAFALGSRTGSKAIEAAARSALGWVAVARGDVAEAIRQFRQTEQHGVAARSVRDLEDAWEGLGAAALLAGDHLEAARALGGAAALRERHGLVLPMPERAGHDQRRAAVCGALREAGFAAAWAEGTARAGESWAERARSTAH